jgi:putative phosphoesterase
MSNFLGMIADTHGLLRPQAVDALHGADIIIHAGDVGNPEILVALQAIAPLYCVRGNIDRGAWAAALPTTEVVAYAGHLLYLLHDRNELDLTPGVAGFDAIISGHSHQPLIEQRQGVLYINPGSAGPRRFTLPTTVGRLRSVNGRLEAEIIDLLSAGSHAL